MRSVIVVILAALAMGSGQADAAIVPQKGIAGVTLGMRAVKVRALLGRPARTERGTNEFGRFLVFHYPGLRVMFQGGATVTSVDTTRRGERTARGVGVGSRESDVRSRVGGVRCRTEFGVRHCFVGAFLPGRRITDFVMRHGRVARVTVGFVID